MISAIKQAFIEHQIHLGQVGEDLAAVSVINHDPSSIVVVGLQVHSPPPALSRAGGWGLQVGHRPCLVSVIMKSPTWNVRSAIGPVNVIIFPERTNCLADSTCRDSRSRVSRAMDCSEGIIPHSPKTSASPRPASWPFHPGAGRRFGGGFSGLFRGGYSR